MMNRPIFFRLVLLCIVGSFASAAPAMAKVRPLSRRLVEKKLDRRFHSEKVELTGMKENYWGLYLSYHVTFKLSHQGQMFHVACDVVDRRPKDLLLSACETRNASGIRVSEATEHSLGLATRTPASLISSR